MPVGGSFKPFAFNIFVRTVSTFSFSKSVAFSSGKSGREDHLSFIFAMFIS